MNRLAPLLFQPTLTPSGLACFGLGLREARPCPALREIVHSYLQIDAQDSALYPVIPDGTQSVFLSPNIARLGGAQTAARVLRLPQAGEYFGIRFMPGGLRHFLVLDLTEITDAYVAEGDVPDRGFADLRHAIYRYGSFHERAAACDTWLLNRFVLRPDVQLDHALTLIERMRGGIRVGQLAAIVGRSERHLNRLFRRHTGLNIKAFIDTTRLQHVSQRLHAQPGAVLDTAHDLGYCDQAHLLNDFRKYTWSTPRTFFARFMSDSYKP
ncbi:MAG: helix-turn-helix domain-containing protein [Acidihalobacter sp.]|uniref:helix-turn-helix domain-containing protein n=1 Tax=Acidihalobacter sp. TaxID=1872108 RepID=UPI00307F99E9